MIAKKHILACGLAVLSLFGGLGPSAYGRHNSNAPKMHKVKKNAGPFGGNYMKPKKQKKPTGYYRNSMTGQMVYGKQK